MLRMNRLGNSEPSADSSVSERRTHWLGSPKSKAFVLRATRASAFARSS